MGVCRDGKEQSGTRGRLHLLVRRVKSVKEQSHRKGWNHIKQKESENAVHCKTFASGTRVSAETTVSGSD